MRYSLENPLAYVQSNVVGFTHVLEACRHAQVGHLAYASTSSVYGANAHALHRGPGGRPPLAVLRRHQAGERADGACLQPPLPAADHRLALLHRLRPLGAAGHGADALRLAPSSKAGRSRSTATASSAATSPTSTTSSRGCSAPPTASPPPIPTGTRRIRTRRPPTPPSASTTSATTPPWASPTSSPSSRPPSAAPPSASSCRCSPATCATPTPTRRGWRGRRTGARRRRSRGGGALRGLVPRLLRPLRRRLRPTGRDLEPCVPACYDASPVVHGVVHPIFQPQRHGNLRAFDLRCSTAP